MKTPPVAETRRSVTRLLSRLRQRLILTHVKQTGLALLAVGLLFAVWLLGQTFFVEGEAPMVSRGGERRLATEVIDRLELWIEEVDAERKAGLALPARSLFVVDE